MVRVIPPRASIPDANGKRCSIARAGRGDNYVLWGADDEPLAEHWSPKWLSESALGSGALDVAWPPGVPWE